MKRTDTRLSEVLRCRASCVRPEQCTGPGGSGLPGKGLLWSRLFRLQTSTHPPSSRTLYPVGSLLLRCRGTSNRRRLVASLDRDTEKRRAVYHCFASLADMTTHQSGASEADFRSCIAVLVNGRGFVDMTNSPSCLMGRRALLSHPPTAAQHCYSRDHHQPLCVP